MMNRWQMQRQFELDWIQDMISYAKSISSDSNSEKYKKALENYIDGPRFIQFKKDWESINGKLEDF